MTDLTNKTVDELRQIIHDGSDIYGPGSDSDHLAFAAAIDELARRDQANDALRSAAQWVATAERDLQASALVNDGLFNAKLEQLQERCGDLRAALAAAPAPSSSGAPAPADPWAPVPCDDYDRNIHANPDANAWADFFVQVHPGLADKHDLMRAWFANAMMAMHDSPRCRPAPADSQREAAVDALAKAIVRAVSELPDRSSPADWPEAMIVEPGELRSIILQACAAPEPAPADAQREAAIEASPYDALGHAMEILAGTPYTGEMASKVAKVLRQWSDKWAAAVDLTCPAPPAPVAPVTVTEGEVEAAMQRCRDAAVSVGADGDGYGRMAEEGAALRTLIARRVAEARGAGLMEFKAWFTTKATWTIEATAEAPAVRGFSVAPRDIDTQIDRLLAAPPASKLAEEPAPEVDWLGGLQESLSQARKNATGEPLDAALLDAVHWLRDGLLSQARRIEALERAAQGGGK